MEKEQWINDVFSSTKKMKRLEASPFLAEKIISRVELSKTRPQPVSAVKWAFAVVAVVLIAINAASLSRLLQDKKKGYDTVAMQQSLNNTVIYNY